MSDTVSWKRMDRFYMNNCKIANELRKYRDLADKVNWVSLSGDPDPRKAADHAQYVVSRTLSYMDMVVANAVYSLWRFGGGQGSFSAETVYQVMAGRMDRRAGAARQAELEDRLQALAATRLYILADQDHQVEGDLYEGAFLPLAWERRGKRLRFRFVPNTPLPLYQYGEDHRQLLEIPFHRLRDRAEDQRNNTDQTLLLRHYLLQELEILLYQGNRVEERTIRLLKKDNGGREFGLLWTLGLVEEDSGQKEARAAAAHNTLRQLLEGWRKEGWLKESQYRLLPPGEGWGVALTAHDSSAQI